MAIENNAYLGFKSYGDYQKKVNRNKTSQITKNVAPVVGAALGVASAMVVSPKIFKTEKTFDKVGRMLSMAGAANVGGVLAGSIGTNKDSKKRKWKEAAFQFMNTSIPMIMVSSILTVCEKVKSLNNNPAKVIGSIVGMVGGAMIATGITNLTRPKGEPARKYTIKDSVANFDDAVATVAIGFEDINKYINADKFLPFIYIYCGSRAGKKE